MAIFDPGGTGSVSLGLIQTPKKVHTKIIYDQHEDINVTNQKYKKPKKKKMMKKKKKKILPKL